MSVDVSGLGAFKFSVLASLRAAQLIRGCRARVEGVHKHTVMARLEVAQGKVTQLLVPVPVVVVEAVGVARAVLEAV
jgi:hypothetical protein